MLQKGIETPGQLFPGCGSMNWRNLRVDWELELPLVKWVLIGLGPNGRIFLKDNTHWHCWNVIPNEFKAMMQERIALLHLKASINYPNGNSLPSWVDNKSSNCCQWERVECNNTSSRVIQLSLNQTRDWESRKEWYFNASLFLPFKEIKTLELSGNALVDWVENEGFEKLSTLTNLEVLDLSSNWINNSKILEFIGGIPSLKSLNLEYNSFGSSVDLTSFKKFSTLTNLEVLDLSFNWIDNSEILEFISGISSLKSLNLGGCLSSVNFTSFEKLSMLINLEVLDLSYNSINNSKILEFIGGISSLKSLNLQDNSLGSSANLTSFEKLSILINLEVLDLSYNSINNSKILEFIGGISSLKSLNLRDNRLGSSVDLTSRNQESKLTNLQVLDLSDNFITNIIWSSLKEFSSLKVLDLSWNYMNESISIQGLCELKTLQEIGLNSNGLKGQLPWCL
ncbi:receptor-like protein 13 [Diospyros lotus]|uniref:receptor-like protein 13 n=1 Tax=Diospyros lotus TaxID=55363 RepID=UPI00224D5CC3|nr:receptor-like protein 13 [Diospyros lotus]